MAEYFKDIKKVEYVGKESKDPLAFHYYDPERKIGNKTMEEHLRFSVAYWHTFTAEGRDMFGVESANREWNKFSDPLDKAYARCDAAFEFMSKLGVKYFCTHDRDLVDEQETLRETNKLLDKVVERIKERMKETGIKLLWGTANLFTHPRFMQGAATSCDADVYAYAAAQVKKALEITKELNGENYVFWGGREGYETLLNTNMELELNNLANFMHMAVDYAKEIGFDGQFLIEPKPKEPTKHQYDFDVASSYAFLQKYDLDKYFKFNIEANHATLAGHTFQHELRYARINNILGSVDANMGDLLLGWDTDQFPTNVFENVLAMYEILKNGGIAPGGLNFDSHVRRPSYENIDLFYAHIAGMDAFALGLILANKILEDKVLEDFVEKRYNTFNEGMGKKIVDGRTNFKELEEYVLDKKVGVPKSGRQEYLENLLNLYIYE
ncbi:xylose isomerase [Petrotoga mobilis SJ95]|jgi:xylose isomerase|uniref:Xylose isomerase n=1 Tax=Petrotoga mobilis (strain DSM 10674 / SJ95) TaxID=403833 RepID=A9BJ27_PETMO|nr:xylose isomerase [Petrotoga mobilis]ABX30972.1 xylose isomerase [Petrotoga mobilis SJ95]